MGGNAIDQTYAGKPGRKPAEEYFRIMERVMWRISNMFPWAYMAPVKAYAKKESFGDGDILIDRSGLPADWISQLHKAFMPQNLVINRFKGTPLSYIWSDNVPAESPSCFSVSLDIMGLQVDLIAVNPDEFVTARTYYAFNDLGNLMGRIAERHGFKYGWDGLWKELHDEKGEVITKLLVSRDIPKIFQFLGYDYTRFAQGFETLEDIFEFAASTPFFSRRIYLLENRNHKSRARDAKRKSYNAFLQWLEQRPDLEKYQWLEYAPGEKSEARTKEKQECLVRAYAFFPGLEEECVKAISKHINAQRAKILWNGKVVSEVTGLKGVALGSFMDHCRWRHSDFDAWVLTQTPGQIAIFIKEVQALQ